MSFEGGCYCKEIRYSIEGDPVMRAQCFCRECQYSTGGDSLFVMGFPEASFKLTQGAFKDFKRSDLENGVTRQFCPTCGTQVSTRAIPGLILVKVGTLDDPAVFGGPDMAIYTCDAQAHHHVPTSIPTFEKLPQE